MERCVIGARLVVLACGASGLAAAAPPPATPIPVEFNCDRFVVTPVMKSGQKLRFYTDTGGGTLMLRQAVLERLGLPTTRVLVAGDNDSKQEISVTPFPPFDPHASIPLPLTDADTRATAYRGRLLVLPDNEFHSLGNTDGFLGAPWFDGRRWTFDYPAGQLSYGDSIPALPPPHTVKLGFLLNAAGSRGSNFASVVASIDGTSMPFLFDTGATIMLSKPAAAAIGRPDATECGTSFIVATLFDAWHAAHADWPVIEGADVNKRGDPIIRVPQVTIAGWTVGPVWFTRRPDTNFHDMMSSMMDVQVEGALGGSLFRYFTIVVDYPRATATFLREK